MVLFTSLSVMSSISQLKDFISGPTLYRIYHVAENGSRTAGRDYGPNRIEFLGESFIKTVSYAANVIYFCSPVVAFYIYKWGVLSSGDSIFYYSKFCIAVLIGLVGAQLVRGYGRFLNEDYNSFIRVLQRARVSKDNRADLQLYDFDFNAWPVDFRWDESVISSEVEPSRLTGGADDNKKQSFLSTILHAPVAIFEYIIAHSIGRPMTYPGSVKLLQAALGQAVLQGRSLLIEKNSLRAKLLACDGNEIDTMFIDKRCDDEKNEGNTLVICSEGNAAFYEVGCMGTPMKAGYSVLGWNHPGFFGSTGLPFPAAERNAVDVVVQYAVTQLGFNIENIVFFAWSIGGYTASYAAMMYPSLKAVVLDATFDNINELAKARMPSFACGLVEKVIQNYLNLDVAQQLVRYPGPVRLIRRSREEILTTVPGLASTNRGNFLLIKLLQSRYPNIFTDESIQVIHHFLSIADYPAQQAALSSLEYDEEQCAARMAAAAGGKKIVFPTYIGESWSPEIRMRMSLFLTMKYMDHFDATHCMPLPSSYFELPWTH